MEYSCLPLHKHINHVNECADVLNEEWQRSKAARVHSLEKSGPHFPYCLVFVQSPPDNGGQQEVIGHSRLCKVYGSDTACFVESVIIKRSLRGKGLGRKLMQMTEEHANRLGFHTVYLTTHDKQDFYHHIGYDYCQPIVSMGNSSVATQALCEKLFGKATTTLDTQCASKAQHSLVQNSNEKQSYRVNNSSNDPSGNIPAPPRPPPPPPGPKSIGAQDITKLPSSPIFWMKKELS